MNILRERGHSAMFSSSLCPSSSNSLSPSCSSSTSSLLSALLSSPPLFPLHSPTSNLPLPLPLPSSLLFNSSSSQSVPPSNAIIADAIRALSLQLLLDQHRHSLLRSVLALATYSTNSPQFDGSTKEKILLNGEKEEEATAAAKFENGGGGDDGQQWKKSEAENEEEKVQKEDEEMRKKKQKTEEKKQQHPAEGRKRKKRSEIGSGGKCGKKAKHKKEEGETDSPVSGMFIREFCDEDELKAAVAELDESAQFVNVTEEARKAIGAIPDRIGHTICALCKIRFSDVFRLAMHKCPRIRHEEYRCGECEKIFSCPANLASHRRWHQPRATANALTE